MNKNKIELVTMSSLEKLLPESEPKSLAYTGFSMLKNEKKSFQVAYRCDESVECNVAVNGALSDCAYIFTVENMPTAMPVHAQGDDYKLVSNNGLYPDLLLSLQGTVTAQQAWKVLWIELRCGEGGMPAGKHTVEVVFAAQGDKRSVALEVEVIDAVLPEQKLVYTNWFHTDCLMSEYKVEAFSDEYWRLVRNYLKEAADYGMNCVLTPIFTPPLDTQVGKERPTVQLVDINYSGGQYTFGFEKLGKWFDLAQECGIRYFEMSHLFTQWGARHAPKIVVSVEGVPVKKFGWKTRANGSAYKKFLKQFAAAITPYIDGKELHNRCYFHVSDEPFLMALRPYAKASKIVHELFGSFNMIDALSDFKIYQKGLIRTPIPATDHIDPFLGNMQDVWAYYCGAQGNHYVSNRFFGMTSLRNRIIGYQLYKHNAVGFLHWGYNYWYSQFSKSVINPYEVTDAGGKFPSGDSFVVYPRADGMPNPSLRLKVFYDGIQDMMALQLLEQKIGRDKTLALLQEDSLGEITFRNYPHSEEWMLNTREKINRAIQNSLSH